MINKTKTLIDKMESNFYLYDKIFAHTLNCVCQFNWIGKYDRILNFEEKNSHKNVN